MPVVPRVFQLAPNPRQLHLKRFALPIDASLLGTHSIGRFTFDAARLCCFHLLFNGLAFPSTCHKVTIIREPEYTKSVTKASRPLWRKEEHPAFPNRPELRH